MNNFFLAFIFLLVNGRLFCQVDAISYKTNVNLAYELAIKDSLYKLALKELKATHKKFGFLYGEEHALKAFCYKMLGKSKKCARSVKDIWSHHALDWDYLFSIESISPQKLVAGFSNKEMGIVNEGYQNYTKLWKHDKADSLLIIVDSLLEKDQEFRIIEPLRGSEIRKADSLNYLVFKNIVLNYGYPGEWFSPGGKGSRANILVVHFADYPWIFKELDPILLNELKAGRMPPSDYLRWLDRHIYASQNKSIYAFCFPPNTEKPSNTEIEISRLKFGVVTCFPIPSNEWKQ